MSGAEAREPSQKLSAKWFEDFAVVAEDGEIEDWPEVARKLIEHADACKIDEAQLESAGEEIERLRNSFDALTEELAIVQRQRSDLARDLTRVITELDALTEANARYLAALQRIASTSIDCITRDTARSAIKGAK